MSDIGVDTFRSAGRQFAMIWDALSSSVATAIDVFCDGIRAQAEQSRRDRDDELDWLGGYQGRRDR